MHRIKLMSCMVKKVVAPPCTRLQVCTTENCKRNVRNAKAEYICDFVSRPVRIGRWLKISCLWRASHGFAGSLLKVQLSILPSPFDFPMPRIQCLPPDTIQQLRSALIIASLAQCAVELLQNAIDAHAAVVEVSVHLEEAFLSVVDDGTGIDNEDFQLIGRRYGTNLYLGCSIGGKEPILNICTRLVSDVQSQ